MEMDPRSVFSTLSDGPSNTYTHRRMGTLWLGGAEGLICPKFYTDNHKHPPLDIARVTSSTLPKFEKHPLLLDIHKHTPLGHCLCDVIIHIPKGLICSFLWPIFSSCFARISPTVCPNFTHCLPEFGGGGSCPPGGREEVPDHSALFRPSESLTLGP